MKRTFTLLLFALLALNSVSWGDDALADLQKQLGEAYQQAVPLKQRMDAAEDAHQKNLSDAKLLEQDSDALMTQVQPILNERKGHAAGHVHHYRDRYRPCWYERLESKDNSHRPMKIGALAARTH